MIYKCVVQYCTDIHTCTRYINLQCFIEQLIENGCMLMYELVYPFVVTHNLSMAGC